MLRWVVKRNGEVIFTNNDKYDFKACHDFALNEPDTESLLIVEQERTPDFYWKDVKGKTGGKVEIEP